MTKIKAFDEALANRETVHTCGICWLLLKSYRDTLETGNERIDIEDIIWEYDYDALVEDMRKYGITEFTISCQFSSLLNAIEALCERGCTMVGMTRIKERFPVFTGGEYETRPALLMKLD